MAYNADELMYRLSHGGVFLSAGRDANTMTIGWGQLGMLWGKPVFFALVRTSRYTQQLIEEGKCFTVSVATDAQKKALGYVGTHSGREEDKWEASGLARVPAKAVDTAVVGECSHYYECRVLTSMFLPPDVIPADMLSKWYPNPDYHTIYVGEIVAEY